MKIELYSVRVWVRDERNPEAPMPGGVVDLQIPIKIDIGNESRVIDHVEVDEWMVVRR